MNEKEIQILVGYNIRHARIIKGLTQKQLSALCGMQKASISRIEGGSINLTIGTLNKIASALDISPGLLFSQAKNS